MRLSQKKANKKDWLAFLILSGLFLKLFYPMFKKKKIKKIRNNLQDFVKQEKREVNELTRGQESLGQFCKDVSCIFKDFFIPHTGNEHRPKILRTKSLAIIAVTLALLKIAVTGYLFLIYPNPASMAELMNQRVLELTNQARIDNQVETLKIDPSLNQAALAKANDMLKQNYFAHIAPNGKKPWDWINRDDYAYLYVGENLGMNFSSAESVHNALMLSPSHKRNILNNNYQDIGIAILSGMLEGQQTNLLVELFASKKSVGLAQATKPKTTTVVSPASQPTIQPPVPSTLPPLVQATETLSVISPPEQASSSKVLSSQTPNQEMTPSPDLTVAPTSTTMVSTNPPGNQLNHPANYSPNQEIDHHLPPNVSYFAAIKNSSLSLADKFINLSNYIFYGVLILMIIALLINIFVKISIQHKSIIIQTLVLIIIIISLIYFHFHLLEILKDQIAVI